MNTISRFSRLIVIVASALFAAIGLQFWFAPELAASRFGIGAVSAGGMNAIRADLGGLFVGMSLLCGAAIWTGRRGWFVAATAVLSAIVIGRSIGWLAVGYPDDLVGLGVEIGVIAALAASARVDSMARAGTRRSLPPAAIAAAIVIASTGAAAGLSPSVQQSLFDAAARERTSGINTAPLADDALRVAICGSSAPLPSAHRAKTCVAVFAAGRFYIVDAGPESVENLVLWGIPLASIDGVLLTHFHSDHIGDLGELNLQTWAGGRPAPLDVYGGPGVERVVAGFYDAYRFDQGYRTLHHTDRVMPAATWPMTAHAIELPGEATPAKDRTALVMEKDGLRITAIEVDHAPIAPAYAYRFDYKGRSAVVTGDLKFHAPLARAADGADLLVSEAIAVPLTRALGEGARAAGRERTAAIMHDIEDYHMTPAQAAQIANEAKVRLLVFYHLLPSPDSLLTRRLFSRGISDVRRGEWTIADDGSLYTLPLGSSDVRIGRLGE
jgi:ribonuclease Z